MVSLTSGHRQNLVFTTAIALCLIDVPLLVRSDNNDSITEHLHLEKPPTTTSSNSSSTSTSTSTSRSNIEGREASHREILVDTVEKRQDCGFNLLARIVAVNSCDRCPKTKARLVMISSYLLQLSSQKAGTRAATRYAVASEYLRGECHVVKDAESEDPSRVTAAEQLSTVDLVNAIPQSTWRRLAEANDEQVEADSVLQDMSIVALLFPELDQLCCSNPIGCSHDDIANNCV